MHSSLEIEPSALGVRAYIFSQFGIVRSTQLGERNVEISPHSTHSLPINEPVKFAKSSITQPHFARLCCNLMRWCIVGNIRSLTC